MRSNCTQRTRGESAVFITYPLELPTDKYSAWRLGLWVRQIVGDHGFDVDLEDDGTVTLERLYVLREAPGPLGAARRDLVEAEKAQMGWNEASDMGLDLVNRVIAYVADRQRVRADVEKGRVGKTYVEVEVPGTEVPQRAQNVAIDILQDDGDLFPGEGMSRVCSNAEGPLRLLLYAADA